MELYHHREFQHALEAFDRGVARGGDTSVFQVSRCYALADLADGPARALTAYRGLPPSGVYSMYATTVLRLLGRKAEAVAADRALREKTLQDVGPRPEWSHRLLEYNAGLISSAELLAAAGPSLLNRCEAHFFIGLTLLADGDRAGARPVLTMRRHPRLLVLRPRLERGLPVPLGARPELAAVDSPEGVIPQVRRRDGRQDVLLRETTYRSGGTSSRVDIPGGTSDTLRRHDLRFRPREVRPAAVAIKPNDGLNLPEGRHLGGR
jgi:hypothetical protein